ncbi:cell division protein FtsQ [Marinimicrobium koreense]|uniref:Cell division protein FtsQ n=1 Tax=Marinimicrobium koreense TaxID=306545 RepID=A0A3N1NM01_9GAMM|nr:cell division protein FtsQ/DivIB [Marinimicrobium koreense]ROQ20824.1 cell division protein FtsQ [Marinimicrobium koreense]
MKSGSVKRIPGQGRVTPRGATRKSQPRKDWGVILRAGRRWVGLVLLVGMLIGAGNWLVEPVSGWLNRPVAEVSVEGTFRYLSRRRIETLLSDQLGEGFLQLDLAAIKQVLEAEPWVAQAALTRRWPDLLHVKIIEEEPIARWGEIGFLDRGGDIIAVDDQSALAHLPLLAGSDADAVAMMERYQDLAQMLRHRGLSIQSLRSDRKNAWRLTLSDGVALVIGRDQVLEKMQRFATVYDRQLSERWDDIEQVDLRYHNGVAVAWKAQQEEAETQ